MNRRILGIVLGTTGSASRRWPGQLALSLRIKCLASIPNSHT
jgi:hypothetical protein